MRTWMFKWSDNKNGLNETDLKNSGIEHSIGDFVDIDDIKKEIKKLEKEMNTISPYLKNSHYFIKGRIEELRSLIGEG